jgi:hypothetical protein
VRAELPGTAKPTAPTAEWTHAREPAGVYTSVALAGGPPPATSRARPQHLLLALASELHGDVVIGGHAPSLTREPGSAKTFSHS